jgi:hypothetical protein
VPLEQTKFFENYKNFKIMAGFELTSEKFRLEIVGRLFFGWMGVNTWFKRLLITVKKMSIF